MWYTLRYEWGRRSAIVAAFSVALIAIVALVVSLLHSGSPSSAPPANVNPHQAAINNAVFTEQRVGMTAERVLSHTPGATLSAAELELVLRETPGAAGVYVISHSPTEALLGYRSAAGQPPLACASLSSATLWNGVTVVPCPTTTTPTAP